MTRPCRAARGYMGRTRQLCCWPLAAASYLFSFCLVLASLPLAAQQDPANIPDSVKRSRPYRRAEWFVQQRAYPLGYIPSGARQQALSEVDQMIANETRAGVSNFAARGLALANGAAGAASGSVWTPMGPQPTSTAFSNNPVSGRLTSIVVDPVSPNTIYIGAAMGGVWKSTDGGANWTPLTDAQPTLAVGAVALDPDNNQSIWVATGEENFGLDNYYGAGILKSSDGGTTWTQLAQSTFGVPVSATPPTLGGAKIGSLAILKGSNGQVAIAAVQFFQSSGLTPASGIYRTGDGGNSWTNVLNSAAGNVVAWDPNNASNCGSSCIGYATIDSSFGDTSNGFYRSMDSGQTWTKIANAGLPSYPTSSLGRIAMGLAKNNTGATIKTTIYLGIGSSSTQNVLSMWKSTDGGSSWSQLTNAPNYCSSQCFYDNVIGVVPNNDSVVFVGGSFSADGGATASIIWRSSDGGSTFQEFSKASSASFSSLHADLHAIAFSPDNSTVYAGTDGGIYASSNATNVNTANTQVTWTNLNGSATDVTKSLAITQFYPGMSITSASYVFGGTQDNGSQLFTGNLVWNQVACGDGAWTAIDPNNQNNLYTACNSGPIDIEKSTSSSPSWFTFSESDTGISTSDRANFIPPLVMDPANSSILYFGSFRLYQTTNGAMNWVEMDPSLANNTGDLTGGGNAHINAIGVGPNNVVWVGTSGNTSGTIASKVQVSTNANLGASATFTDRSTGLPNRAVTQVMPDPADATGGTAYVTFSGFDQYTGGTGGDHLGYVYKTSNSGATWTNLTGNLPHSPVNDIVIDPSIANTLYVATDVGVFYTSNANVVTPTWNTLVGGLPKSAVLSLKLHNASRTLIAGTHGRGVWRVVPGGLATVAPATLTFGAQGFSLASAPQSVTITNTGNAAITLNTLSTGSAEFAIVSPSSSRPARIPTCVNAMILGGGASCSVYIAFTPNGAGARNAILTIANSGVTSPLTVSLSGTGPTAAAVSLLPSPVAFGNVIVNGDATIPVAVSNATGGAVSLANFSVPTGYSQTSNCPASLNAGAGCVIFLTFQPLSLSSFSGNLSVTAGGNAVTASVSGTGSNPAESLGRPNTTPGTAAAGPTTLNPLRPSRPVRSTTNQVVAGSMATVPLVFSSDAASGTASLACLGAPDGVTCTVEPATLKLRGASVGANVKLSYNDAATAPGEYQVQVVARTESFSSVLAIPIRLVSRRTLERSDAANAQNAPPALRSSDTPAPEAFDISPARLEFTSADRRRDAAAREITITNRQAAPLAVAIDSVEGDFVESNDCGVELQPSSSCRVRVRLRADVPFPVAGHLNIRTSAGSATVELLMRYDVRPQERD